MLGSLSLGLVARHLAHTPSASWRFILSLTAPGVDSPGQTAVWQIRAL